MLHDTRGTSGFLNEKGEFIGETKLNLKTYAFLLIAWREIQEMMSAEPPKTRNNLWEWWEVFSLAGWIEIKDLDQQRHNNKET